MAVSNRLYRIWGIWLAAALLMLGGCASSLSARVTTFQQWPVGAQGEYYRIVPAPQQAGNLQFGAYADMLRAAIGATGLREATEGAQARFDVSIEYGSTVRQVWERRYEDAYMYHGWPGWAGYYGGWGRWGGGFMYYTPRAVNVPVDVYRNTLTVTMHDSLAGGKEVYRASAVHDSGSENLTAVMPYLMQAIFDDFPGNNGQVKEVRYELSR